MRTDAVKGYLDLLLLSELDRGAGQGYALIERLRQAAWADGAQGHLREWQLFSRAVERVVARAAS